MHQNSFREKKKGKIWKKDKESWRIEWGDPKYTYWNFFFFFGEYITEWKEEKFERYELSRIDYKLKFSGWGGKSGSQQEK